MSKQPEQKPLTNEEIDEIVIAQVDDDDAWEEEFSVTPVSRSRTAQVHDSEHPGQRSR
jgi:hypothetical protein